PFARHSERNAIFKSFVNNSGLKLIGPPPCPTHVNAFANQSVSRIPSFAGGGVHATGHPASKARPTRIRPIGPSEYRTDRRSERWLRSHPLGSRSSKSLQESTFAESCTRHNRAFREYQG